MTTSPNAAPPASAPRLPGLDLLRALAISWVMLYHASLFGLASTDYWTVLWMDGRRSVLRPQRLPDRRSAPSPVRARAKAKLSQILRPPIASHAAGLSRSGRLVFSDPRRSRAAQHPAALAIPDFHGEPADRAAAPQGVFPCLVSMRRGAVLSRLPGRRGASGGQAEPGEDRQRDRRDPAPRHGVARLAMAAQRRAGAVRASRPRAKVVPRI